MSEVNTQVAQIPKSDPKVDAQAVAKRAEARRDMLQAVVKVDGIVDNYQKSIKGASSCVKSYYMATAIIDISESIKPLGKMLMQLQGKRVGFSTDIDMNTRQPRIYPEEVVVRVATEALIRGLRWNGNEFTIMYGGHLHINKEGYIRLVREFDGLTDLRVIPSPPVVTGNKAVVEMSASWKLHGVPNAVSVKIPVAVNSKSTDAQLVGKAERAILMRVYGILTGSEQTEPVSPESYKTQPVTVVGVTIGDGSDDDVHPDIDDHDDVDFREPSEAEPSLGLEVPTDISAIRQ